MQTDVPIILPTRYKHRLESCCNICMARGRRAKVGRDRFDRFQKFACKKNIITQEPMNQKISHAQGIYIIHLPQLFYGNSPFPSYNCALSTNTHFWNLRERLFSPTVVPLFEQKIARWELSMPKRWLEYKAPWRDKLICYGSLRRRILM